jgi:hypothetical protein
MTLSSLQGLSSPAAIRLGKLQKNDRFFFQVENSSENSIEISQFSIENSIVFLLFT